MHSLLTQELITPIIYCLEGCKGHLLIRLQITGQVTAGKQEVSLSDHMVKYIGIHTHWNVEATYKESIWLNEIMFEYKYEVRSLIIMKERFAFLDKEQ